MSMQFQDLWGEIKQSFPNLSPFLAKRFVQRAVVDIYTSHQWNFLTKEGVLFSPAIITSGTFSITQFSNTIVADAAAIAALNGLINPVLTKRQIRFNSFGDIYNIIGVDPLFAINGLLTLDRPIVDPTTPTATYMCYRCYYGPPMEGISGAEVTDFMRYNTIYFPSISDYFKGVQWPRDILNKKDPQRTSIGLNPYYLFIYKSASDGSPLFEMWPHPTAANAYICSYQQQGITLTNPTDVMPSVIPDDLIIEKAMQYGCLWAYKNQSRYEALKGVNWMLLAQAHKKAYSNFSTADPGILEITQRQDEEISPQSIIVDDRSYNLYPVGDDDRTGFYSINPNP